MLPKLSSPLTHQMTGWGWTGVEVFFVISGFVIPYSMLRSTYCWRHLGRFLIRRVVRIWPPSVVLIALTCLQYAFINWIGKGDSTGWTQLSAGRIAANLFYAVPFTGDSWLNGILWTLSVEFQFYIFLALIFPLITAHRGWLVALGWIALISALFPFAATALFFRYAIYFAMGGLVLIYREGGIDRWRALAILGLMAAVAVAQLGWLPSVFALATSLIIGFGSLKNRALVFLGTISYSLYLVHILVSSTLEYAIVRVFGATAPAEKLVAQSVCLAAAILGAWIFYLVVERHFVALSQRLGDWRAEFGRTRPGSGLLTVD